MTGAVPPMEAPVVSPTHWSTLHDAWHAAWLASQSDAAKPKEPLPIDVLIAIVKHRILEDPALRCLPDVQASLSQRVTDLHSHLRDALGQNWDVPARAVGGLAGHGGEEAFRRLVNAMRAQFDLS